MTAEPQRMFFRSEQVEAHWDTWMYYHEGTYYLYYLITEHSPGEGFGVATSDDGVSWTDHGWALRASDKMVTYLGTGAVWRNTDAAKGGRFICNYSEWRREGDRETQNILFAWSDDLIHWTKYGDDNMFRIDTRWYEQDGRWDCIYPLCRPEGGYYGYWTATPRDRVGFGFGQSEDGLCWEALPAPLLDWAEVEPPTTMEAGATEEFGGRYYAITGQPGGRMRTMIADIPAGPFKVAPRNYGLMENSGALRYTYFARFLRTLDGVLVNHQAIPRFQNEHGRPLCYFAPLKRAYVDQQGTLWLRYWEGNDQLKKRHIALHWVETGENIRVAQRALDTRAGVVLEGTIQLPQSDVAGAGPGLYIEYGERLGTAILVGPEGVTEFGPMQLSGQHETVETTVEDTMAREWPFGESVRFRLLLKDSVLEFYMDDVYIQSYSMLGEATGRIGLLGAEAVADTMVWQTG